MVSDGGCVRWPGAAADHAADRPRARPGAAGAADAGGRHLGLAGAAAWWRRSPACCGSGSSAPRTAFIFDETYYAKDGWSLLHFGAEQNYIKAAKDGDPDPANVKILAGHLKGIWTGDPSYVVHPPGGKWMIGLGEQMFGMTPFGWRFMVAVMGTLAVLMTARIGRRLFRSTLLGCVAGLLLTVDGMAYVHSRTALLDPLLMFWALAAFGALVVDRDRSREQLAARIDETVVSRFGPALGLRPWRLLAGFCLGAACATKWSGLYFVAVFGVMALLWDMGARRTAGARRPWLGAVVRDAAPAFASLVLVAVAVYLASWTGWFLAGDHAYLRYWAQDNPGGPGWMPDALRSLCTTTTRRTSSTPTCAPRTTTSRTPGAGWSSPGRSRTTTRARPWASRAAPSTSAPARSAGWGHRRSGGPPAWRCRCWSSCGPGGATGGPARSWPASSPGYVPWFFFQERTVYSFYAVAFVPFLVLAVAQCLGLVIGGPRASPQRRQWGAAAAGAYLLLAVANFRGCCPCCPPR